ncbi:branched-chain amino acid ABC transporter permease, partial [Burkholderia sp. Ac-20384]|nr:branched-chain amino acid ABC transporter permease [Burkholderia sp. Ac-20384]
MHAFALQAFNGLSYGLLLFMLSAGLTLIFSVQGVLNFAHASFYMLGAYVGYSIAAGAGFWPALVLAPLAIGLLGAGCERMLLRRVQARGHTSELLLTFGLAYLIGEGAKLVWGLAPLPAPVPALFDGAPVT